MLQEYSEAGEQATSSGERAGQEEGEERLEERRGVAWVQGWREEGGRSAMEQPGGRHTCSPSSTEGEATKINVDFATNNFVSWLLLVELVKIV